jgi:L-fucose isomerase-like protein
MEQKDCNAFTAPCPDACSTRRFNESKFTFCFTHSLNMEDMIPSACEYDVNSVITQQALIAVSGKCPYMGNTRPMPYVDGEFFSSGYFSAEELLPMRADPENICFTEHSVPNRRLRDPEVEGPYALRHFAYDQKFGAVFRYDFTQDKGQVITLARFSPDCTKLMIAKGTIVGGGGYDRDNCNTIVAYKVSDRKDFWKKQTYVGNHMCLVYGDYVQDLINLADNLGVEVLLA